MANGIKETAVCIVLSSHLASGLGTRFGMEVLSLLTGLYIQDERLAEVVRKY
jgi:hypothetical protein